jgi:Fe-S cluster assembly ATP-binding protein
MNLNSPLLEVKGLEVSINENEILKGLNLTVNKGEIHAIMGPNGSGKVPFLKFLLVIQHIKY